MPRSRKKAYSSQNVSSVSNLTINRAALLPNTADFADRLFAYLIDLFLLLLLLGIYYVSLGSNTPNIIEAIIAGGVFFGYFFAFTFFGNGQTLGQYVLKLQTVPATFTEDHFVIEKTHLSVLQCVLNAFGKIVFIVWLDLILGFFVSKAQQKPTRIFQYLANTLVISRKGLTKKK